jgi:hypothetical protein
LDSHVFDECQQLLAPPLQVEEGLAKEISGKGETREHLASLIPDENKEEKSKQGIPSPTVFFVFPKLTNARDFVPPISRGRSNRAPSVHPHC